MHQSAAHQEPAHALLVSPEEEFWPSAGLPRRLSPVPQTQQLEKPGACIWGYVMEIRMCFVLLVTSEAEPGCITPSTSPDPSLPSSRSSQHAC